LEQVGMKDRLTFYIYDVDLINRLKLKIFEYQSIILSYKKEENYEFSAGMTNKGKFYFIEERKNALIFATADGSLEEKIKSFLENK